MKKMAEAVENRNFVEMQRWAYSIKDNCGWLGASRMHYSAYWIQKMYDEEQFEVMLLRYPALVEAIIEYKRYMPKVVARLMKDLPPNK